jgi:uncharacterized protein YyaL (SSP411 family)
LLDALIESMQTHWRSEDLSFAIQLADDLLARFEDPISGGFFFTASDHEELMHRSKSFADDAMPSGNGIAAQALQRLGLLLGETRYLNAADRVLRAGWNSVTRYPHGHCSMLIALAENIDPIEVVIIRGPERETERWADELAKVYAPHRLVFAIPDSANDLPSALAEKTTAANEVTAYLCRGTTCSPPVKSLAALLALSGQRA